MTYDELVPVVWAVLFFALTITGILSLALDEYLEGVCDD